jgi:hypothetical protein
MSHLKIMAKYSNPLDMVRLEAKKAACREARFQLERLDAINPKLEPPEFLALARSWRTELRRLLDQG